MKVALCLSGQLRTADKCFPSIEKNILSLYNPDVFISTDGNQEFVGVIGAGKSNWNIDDVIQAYKPKRLELTSDEQIASILKQKGYDFEDLERRRQDSCNITRYTRALYRIYESTVYANDYSFIIRCRFDLQLDEPLQFHLSDSITIPVGQDWLDGINDQIAWGTERPMKIYSNLVEVMPSYHQIAVHPEKMLRHHLEHNMVAINRIPYQYRILR